jgi:hypothetical protein
LCNACALKFGQQEVAARARLQASEPEGVV